MEDPEAEGAAEVVAVMEASTERCQSPPGLETGSAKPPNVATTTSAGGPNVTTAMFPRMKVGYYFC